MGEKGCTVADTINLLVGKDAVLVKVGEGTGLVDERRRETIGVRLVVDELSVDKVVNLTVAMSKELRWMLLIKLAYIPLVKRQLLFPLRI